MLNIILLQGIYLPSKYPSYNENRLLKAENQFITDDLRLSWGGFIADYKGGLLILHVMIFYYHVLCVKKKKRHIINCYSFYVIIIFHLNIRKTNLKFLLLKKSKCQPSEKVSMLAFEHGPSV